MFKTFFIYLSISSSILLSGCATVNHVPLSKDNSHLIKSIYVNPQIAKSKKMYEFVSGAEFGFAFGAAGGLVSGVANGNAAETMQDWVEKNRIDIRKIVYARWLHQIKDKTNFKLANMPTDTILTTTIEMYGISIPHGFSTDYIPVLVANAKLVRNEQVIWQDTDSVMPFTSGMPRYKMDQILHDPKKLSQMWDKAAEKIINDMLDGMSK